MPETDPWTAFLDWLTTVIVPDWNAVISLLPFLVLIGVVGPILTVIALMWLWHFFTRKRSHVVTTEPEVVAAPVGTDGVAVFPANVPYCLEHGLIYPASRTHCEIDGTDLSVRCPVDGTIRDAAIQTCSACGTRFVLGAAPTAALVRHPGRPPEGGAAVA